MGDGKNARVSKSLFFNMKNKYFGFVIFFVVVDSTKFCSVYCTHTVHLLYKYTI